MHLYLHVFLIYINRLPDYIFITSGRCVSDIINMGSARLEITILCNSIYVSESGKQL